MRSFIDDIHYSPTDHPKSCLLAFKMLYDEVFGESKWLRSEPYIRLTQRDKNIFLKTIFVISSPDIYHWVRCPHHNNTPRFAHLFCLLNHPGQGRVLGFAWRSQNLLKSGLIAIYILQNNIPCIHFNSSYNSLFISTWKRMLLNLCWVWKSLHLHSYVTGLHPFIETFHESPCKSELRK